MIYQGSKAKLRKYILPILQNCINENHIETYIECFVGGANMIDHIMTEVCSSLSTRPAYWVCPRCKYKVKNADYTE